VSIKRIGQLAVVVASLLAFAGITPAGADDFLIHPGQFKGSGISAFAQGFDESTGTSFFVELQTGFISFRPHRPGGPPVITLDGGVVNASFNNFSTFGFGCWLMPKTSIVVDSNMTATLTLDTSDPSVTECPGDPIGDPVLGAPPSVGPSGLVLGLDEPLVVSLTWTPAGPITSSRVTTRMSCKPYQSISEGTGQSVDSTISGSATIRFSGADPYTANFAGGSGDLSTGQNTENVTGPPSEGCGPF